MRTRSVALLCTATVLIGLAFAGTAGAALPPEPYTDNAQCLVCHGQQDSGFPSPGFNLAPVDRESACWKCHWQSSHPIHYVGGQCSGCHWGWGPSDPFRTPAVVGEGGWFHSAESTRQPAADLHRIHFNARWTASLSYRGRQCQSCHQVAACSDCHEDFTAHAQHARTADGTYAAGSEPKIATVGHGTPIGDDRVNTVSTEEVSCNADACHRENAYPDIFYIDDYYGTGIKSGYWDYNVNTGHQQQMASYTNQAGASYEATFTGKRVSIQGLRHPDYGGVMNVYLDGLLVGTATTLGNVEYRAQLWLSDPLGPGDHTLRLVHAGTRAGGSSSFFVFDGLNVYDFNDKPSPDCTSCHTQQSTLAHAYSDSGHSADLDALSAGDGHFCTECHSTDLLVEHSKSTSNGSADACATCHRAGGPREQITGAWDLSCTTAACHGEASAQPMHSTYCGGCHENENTDFSVRQTNFAAPSLNKTKCLTCHGTGIINAGSYKIGRRWVSYRHLSHNATDECAGCHYWEPRRTEFYTHTVKGAYGFFASVDSTNPAPARAHSVHVNGSWAAPLEFAPQIYCGNCHKAAGCGSCHEVATMPAAHANHGTQTTQTVLAAPGATSYTAPKAALVPETRSCTAADCHGSAATQVPTCTSCHTGRSVKHW